MNEPSPRSELPEIIAHRGYSAVAPENTLAAVNAAMDAGAPAVEVDVQTAIDGTPVLFHDVHLGRTSSGVGPVRRRTVGQLKALDVGTWFSDDFAGERIPTLAEAVDAVKGRLQRFYPEVKGYREMEDLDRMVDIVREGDLVSRTVFISEDWVVLERIGQVEPSVGLGYIVEDRETLTEALERASGDDRSLVDLKAEVALADPDLVRLVRSRDTEIAVWTVDDPEDASRLRDLGVNRITTNEVSRLLSWRDDLSNAGG